MIQKNKQKSEDKAKKLQLRLDKQSLVPTNTEINLITSFDKRVINSQKLSKLYLGCKKQALASLMIQPLQVIKNEKKEGEQKQNSDAQSITVIFNANNNGYYQLKRFLPQQISKLATQILNNIIIKILELFLIFLEHKIYAKIKMDNLYVAQQTKQSIKLNLMLLEQVSSGSQLQFISQIDPIFSKLSFQQRIKSRSQLQDTYIQYLKSMKIGEKNNIHFLQQLGKNKKLLNDIVHLYGPHNLAHQKTPSSNTQLDLLNNQQITWLFNQLGIKQNGHLLHYRSSIDGLQPKYLWEHLTMSANNKQILQQLLIIEISAQSNSAQIIKIGFFSSVFLSSPAKQILKKPPKFGSYLTESVNSTKKPSCLISFKHKTIHRLHDPEFAVGYDPLNNILLCIGKCDIILSKGGIANLCYFPVSYSPDSQLIVNTHEHLCGGQQFQLNDLYVYRFKK